jgi:RND family efflux transporter MFP subunit
MQPDKDTILRYTPPRRLKLYGIIAACIAAGVVVLGIASRLHASTEVADWTDAQAIPTVKIINLAASTEQRGLTLPGDVQAFNSAPIYSRVSGYLKAWYADIGAQVKAGQVLATIDVPDQDQQLAQAKADLNTAEANQRLAAVTAKRWNELLARGAVSRQEVDEKNGDLAAKNAVVASGRANVQRLQDLTTFKNIAAPFDGIVTTRATDVGALISVGAPNTTPLFTVVDDRKLRIYVRVPQSYSTEITANVQATFTVPEHPGKSYTATVVTTAQAVDTVNGSVLVQLQTDNADRSLRPGAYAQVHFALAQPQNVVQVPASALMFRDGGMTLATLGPNNRVVLKPVTIGHDYGTTVEIASGVTHTDKVIDSPPDSLRQGDEVKVAAADKPQATKPEGH